MRINNAKYVNSVGTFYIKTLQSQTTVVKERLRPVNVAFGGCCESTVSLYAFLMTSLRLIPDKTIKVCITGSTT